ncbi:ScbA/BarX family gamma-butyrolactone biosynthesis protein [Angustibacter sp. McL0619]|uniref:ScbA/BarX family gamma-butyrolactone biosynthesis protein n=1 Tax=Angustibacter sp. McL0619 TaxID=3415676 RepID=UPI003CEEAA72
MSVVGDAVRLAGGPAQQAIPRRLVHRSSIAEVFVTGVEVVGGNVRVGAQWPRANRFHLEADGLRYDPLLAVETFRQAVIAAGHVVDAVCAEDRFVMVRTRLAFSATGWTVGAEPGCAVLELARSGDSGRRSTAEVRISCEGAEVVMGMAEVVVLEAADYARLRGSRPRVITAPVPMPASQVAAERVGRHFDQDVLVDQDPRPSGGCALRVDPTHPVHFDHPQDHVPGMLLIDAARQVALLMQPQHRMSGLEVQFTRFVELGQTCHIVASLVTSPAGRAATVVQSDFNQGGQSRARIRVRVEPC